MSSLNYTCLIVDDEPIARKIIRGYIEQIPNLVCVGEFKNAFEAMAYLNGSNQEVALIFIDINMPNLSGISMVKILPSKYQIIFTTAYSEYAVESYELDAVDYLLKPFLFERLAQAVFKAFERLKNKSTSVVITEPTKPEPLIFVKSDGESYPVRLNDILYCEAMKNYTKVVMSNGNMYYPLVPFFKFEEELSLLSSNFVRVHRSFLVSKNHLSAVGANYVMIEKNKIPVGSQYREVFLSHLGLR